MTNTSNHFTLEEWADFGRGRTPAEPTAEMQRHLDHGCPTCTQNLEVWKGVLEAARREEAFEPPAGVVRCAKALFAAMPPLMKTSPLRVLIAHMTGFGRPGLEGVRSGGSSSHFLFREGDLLLDLHLQPRPSSELVSIVGQILDSTQPERRFENRPVALMRRQDALAHASTNEFGEFHLEFTPGEDQMLMIEIENGSYLVSHLPRLEQ